MQDDLVLVLVQVVVPPVEVDVRAVIEDVQRIGAGAAPLHAGLRWREPVVEQIHVAMIAPGTDSGGARHGGTPHDAGIPLTVRARSRVATRGDRALAGDR
ncbi:hypothetical protein RE9414_17200 [Prescottella equi]|nr:hypothetical protein RE9414_17200 [Prescottella equi]